MLKSFQERFRLPTTGNLDDATKKQMSQPRCGNKDSPSRLSGNDPRAFIQKWSRSKLTWTWRNYSPYISQAETEIILQDAFNTWTKHIPIEIRQVCYGCQADFVIDFFHGDHGDGYRFDGPGKTLAHAYFPQDGRIHFDMEERWTTSFDDDGINLYLVAVHEIGHALGLEHTNEKHSIMYPSYQLIKKRDMLPEHDRIHIQYIYGAVSTTTRTPTTKKTTRSTPPTTRTKVTTRATTKTTTRATTIRTTSRKSSTSLPTKTRSTTQSTTTRLPLNQLPCGRFVDAAFDFPDKTFHILDTGLVRRYLPDKKKWDARATQFQYVYSRLPDRITGGAYNFGKNEIFIFSSTRVYRYKIRTSSHKIEYLRDDPLPTHLLSAVVGAIFYQDEIHVIKAKTLQSFHSAFSQKKSTEKKLSDEFPGITGSVKAAFTYGFLHHFFTSDRLVYVWDEQFNQWKTFGKPMNTNWFVCQKK